jgi:acyl carrier protein
MYGPTETTIWSALELVKSAPQRQTIGRPIANTQIYLLDSNLQLVPIGVSGEIHIGGDGLARAYLHRPELTTEKFIANPFGPGRLYKTGDWGRYLPNGNIEFLGRMDQQVKIRGFRIELGEIETVIGAHPEVQKVVAVARPGLGGEKRLVAYFTTTIRPDRQEELISALRENLKQKLPEYMLPNAFVILEEFPLTPNGKIDRKALPEPQLYSKGEEQNQTPQTAFEKTLADLWSEVLGVENIGRGDNFFNLGGHSLLATRLFARIREALRLELPLRTIFEAPILADLAKQLEKASTTTASSVFQSKPRPDRLPLSFGQERLWVIAQLDPKNPVYNLPLAFHLRGIVDIPALEQSLTLVSKRHEALRTIFAYQDEQPYQIIQPPHTLHLQIVDQPNDWQAWIEKESSHPFDLTSGPLIRAALLKLSSNEAVLFINIHHVATDGWSTAILLKEISVAYSAFSRGETVEFPFLPMQYADFAIWQREQLQGETLETLLDYWRSQLQDVSTILELPTEHPRPAAQSYRGATQEFASIKS